MTEEKQDEVKNEEPATLLEEAKKASDELRELINQKKAIVDEEQKQKAMNMLKGRAEAGMQAPPKAESAKEYAKKIMSGGLNNRKE